jgi:hypothetical protein
MSRPAIKFNVSGVGVVLIATILAVENAPCEAATGHIKHRAHHQASILHVQNAQASLNQSQHLGTMRYYGGPKSPMWREVQ